MENAMDDFLDFLGIDKNSVSIYPLGDGHINDTYRINAPSGLYVIQRISKSIDIDAIEFNYDLYSRAFKNSLLKYPVWKELGRNRYHYTDSNGYNWRLYPYIDGDIPSYPLSNESLYACGQGLAELHNIFDNISEFPHAAYPHLHDINYYYMRYLDILSDQGNDFSLRNPEIENLISERIGNYTDSAYYTLDCVAIIHGDTKIANMLFDNNKVTAFLDMDTLMMGSRIEDIADCVRSCCIHDGCFDGISAKVLTEGYKSIYKKKAYDVDNYLSYALNKICFELALRYYTDYLSGNKVFKEKYPGYHFDRTISLLKKW